MIKAPSSFIAVLVFVTLALGGVVVVLKNQNAPQVSPTQDAIVLSATYSLALQQVVGEYRAVTVQAQAPNAAKAAEAKLLNLTVPKERREFHLDLILAMHKLSLAKSADLKAIESAQQKVEAVLESASAWLQ